MRCNIKIKFIKKRKRKGLLTKKFHAHQHEIVNALHVGMLFVVFFLNCLTRWPKEKMKTENHANYKTNQEKEKVQECCFSMLALRDECVWERPSGHVCVCVLCYLSVDSVLVQQPPWFMSSILELLSRMTINEWNFHLEITPTRSCLGIQ